MLVARLPDEVGGLTYIRVTKNTDDGSYACMSQNFLQIKLSLNYKKNLKAQ